MRFQTLLALAILGAAGLGLELSLTRLVSTLHSPTYVYLVLSVALLGLGLGAALLSLYPNWQARGVVACVLAGLSTAALTLLVLKVAGLPPVLLFALATVPFVFIGLAIAALFARQPHESATLYWADLSGAGLGALLALPLMSVWGVPNTLLASALAFGLAGALLATAPRLLATAVLGCGAAVLAAGANLTALNPSALSDKPLGSALDDGGTVARTRWDALTRTDLIYNAEEGAYALYMDGGAGSVVPDLSRPERWQDDIGSFPFLSDAPERTFLLGPGGGLDVALAKASGATDIVTAELNAAGVELVRGLAPRTGDVYGGVDLIHGEGRTALSRGGRFDLIFLSHVVTGSAELRTQNLSESTLYTTEAFHDYLDHLTPTGQIAIKLYDEVTLTRALTTAVRVLSERGATEAEAMTHLVALLETRGERPVPLLLIRKGAVSSAEAVRLGRLAERRGHALLLLPHLLYPERLEGVAAGDETLAEVIAAAGRTDLRPTTDDRPFFFLFEGAPRSLTVLLVVLTGVLLGLWTLSLRAFRNAAGLGGWRAGPLFAALGAGFMLAEVFVLQRSQLVVGHPTRTLSWVLAVLLVSGGLGSYLLARRARSPRPWVGLSCLLVVLTLLLWGALESLHLPALTLLLTIVPVGAALGIPFASALRGLEARQTALAWAFSGVGSVLGSVLALLLATRFGYHAVLWAGLGAYGLAALSGMSIVRVRAAGRPPVPDKT